MAAKLQMISHQAFGYSRRVRLNPALLEALQASRAECDYCGEVERDVEPLPEGGEFVEAATFPGRSIQKLDAHFRAHWKADYELVDGSGRRMSP